MTFVTAFVIERQFDVGFDVVNYIELESWSEAWKQLSSSHMSGLVASVAAITIVIADAGATVQATSISCACSFSSAH